MAERSYTEKSENRKEISINALYREGLDSNLVSSDFLLLFILYRENTDNIFMCM